VTVIIFIAVLVCLAIWPRVTIACGAAFAVMFLYVWIYDPQCQNYAKDHPEWGGKCGVQFKVG
jgi:hypothetical protein